MRYVFGPDAGLVSVAPKPTIDPAAPVALADLQPTVTADGSGVTLNFPAFDPAATAAPAEVRAYWILEGTAAASLDAPNLVGSATPCSHAAVEITAAGLNGVVLPTPDAAYPPSPAAPAASYMVKTVLGFNV